MSKLYFRYSTMGAGKSLQLIAAAHNYLERNMGVMLFNFRGDNRFGENKIASRTGLQMESIPFDNSTNFKAGIDDVLARGQKPDAIFIDEAQFLTEDQVKDLHDISVDRSIPILAYGLRTDFLGRLFEGSKALMAHAETIEELKTICYCGKKATHVLRFSEGKVCKEGNVVQIGDVEYTSVCYPCFKRNMEC